MHSPPLPLPHSLRCGRSLAEQLETACQLEAQAAKPGNVHPGVGFADLTYLDFVNSARVVAPILARSQELGVGRAIYEAALATRQVVGKNTNLGILLLLAPLAAVPQHLSLREGVRGVLDNLTQADSEAVYAAIAVAQPGGMGEQAEQDLSARPTLGLVDIMRLASDRDRVARQYAEGFREVFDVGVHCCERWIQAGHDWETCIIGTQLDWLASGADTLIVRKVGGAIGEEASRRAVALLEGGWPVAAGSQERLNGFDAWLRADGHRRNPGTTADLVAATLFVVLREQSR